jgi:two-component system LytT family sensor kinase
VTSGPASQAPRAPLPPIARQLAWTEWLLVAAVWLALGLAAAGVLTDYARLEGIGVAFRDVLAVQVIGWLVWLALLRPLFAVLDATPVAPRQRLRHALARVAIWLGAAAAHAAIVYTAVALTDGPLGIAPALWATGIATPRGAFILALLNALVPFAAYAILRRAHRRRAELAHAADLERSLLKARLHALDLELRPHFLFNTLNAITALVRSEPAQAERMLVTLAGLLRATLGRTGREVTVEEELEQLDLYLDIQRVRFRDRLRVQMDADAEALHAYVPGMILQPLVENALTHGIAPKAAGGTVRVSVTRENDGVVLRVADDGVGLPPAGPRERTGVGNTRERLRSLYGDAHAFTLAPQPSGGTVAEVRVPYRAAPTRTAEFPIGIATQQRPPDTPPPAKGASAA